MLRTARGRRRTTALALLFLTAATPAAAEAVPVDPPPASALDSDTLAPGEYRWRAEAAKADAPVRIVVSLPLQRAWVFSGDALVGVSTVSTGRPGYDTPAGTFTILQKRREHYSNLYDNAPMPFMQRLTWDGIALHGGAVRAEPASHGCIRLPHAFARRLFALTSLGAEVVVTDEAPNAPDDALLVAAAN